MAITGSSAWRTLGDLTLAQFKALIPANSPMLPQAEAIYNAARGYTALYGAHCGRESEWALTGEGANIPDHNPVGNKDHVNGGYMTFASWPEAAAWWVQHVTDPKGPYAATKTVAEYVHVYAPKEDGNDEGRYVQAICDVANQVTGAPVVNPTPTPTPKKLTFGNVPKPPIIDRIIPDSDNIAWDHLGDWQDKIYGLVYHTQVGTNWGTDGWFRMMWQPDGTPGGGQLGLTDFGVTRQGKEILMWNNWRGAAGGGASAWRAPWASGPWQNPPGGDGHAFVAKYGVNGINRFLRAIEIDQYYDTPLTQDGIDTIVWLSAYLADQAGVPYTDYPIFPKTGLTFTYTHNEFQNNKPCAGQVIIDATVNIFIPQTKAMLEHYQTASVPGPAPVPPSPPAITYATPNVPTFLKKWPWVQEVTFSDVTATLRTDVFKANKDGVKVYQFGATGAAEVRAPLQKGEQFVVVYGWEKGSDEWGISPYGSRILLNDCTRVGEWTPQQIDAPAQAVAS